MQNDFIALGVSNWMGFRFNFKDKIQKSPLF